MANLLVAQFNCRFFVGELSYIVLTRQEHDGTTSLLLYADRDGMDLSETPPLMMLSDSVGDRLSARVTRVQAGESRELAVTLLRELAGELNDNLPLPEVTDLVGALAAWIKANSQAPGGDPFVLQ